MASYVFIDKVIGKDSPTATGTVKLWPLGLTAAAKDDTLGYGEFVYLQGSTNAAGALVQIRGGTAVVMSAALSASAYPLGVAAGALSGTGVYGWVQVRGLADNVKGTNADMAAGVPLYLHAGAGQLASAVVAGNRIQGAFLPASVGSALASVGSATVQLQYPIVAGLTASL